MKNLKVLYIISGILFVCLIVIYLGTMPSSKKTILIENKSTSKNGGSQMISMMYETEAGSGVYEVSADSAWPTSGYTFNETLSKCENGSTLTWNEDTKSVTMIADLSDKCYVYFDKDFSTLANHIISLYGNQGENGLYLHDSTLANSANDGSYRYAGANPDNYVCFGSDAITCPEDNLYRIIGVFEDQIKLIKSTVLVNMTWDDSGVNTWSTSTLNTYLNVTYLGELETKWQNMIARYTWQVGGMAESYSNTAKQYYDEELNSGTTYSAKIGLMYVSDYGFAVDPTYWTTALYDYANVVDNNWLYDHRFEWTISRYTDNNWGVFSVLSSGGVYNDGICVEERVQVVRPSFYILSTTKIAGGNGTQENPYRLS